MSYIPDFQEIVFNKRSYFVNKSLVPHEGEMVISSDGWIGTFDENCAANDELDFFVLIDIDSISY